jgi:hypothetical protein
MACRSARPTFSARAEGRGGASHPFPDVHETPVSLLAGAGAGALDGAKTSLFCSAFRPLSKTDGNGYRLAMNTTTDIPAGRGHDRQNPILATVSGFASQLKQKRSPLRRHSLRAAIAALSLLAACPAKAEEHSWWLNVFFHQDGEWRPGHEIDGWSAREYDSKEECGERKSYAEAECSRAPLKYPTVWICSRDAPLKEPPPSLRGVLC